MSRFLTFLVVLSVICYIQALPPQFGKNSGTCWFCPSDQCCNLWHCCPYGYVCCPTITLDNTCCISNTNIPWEPGMA